jgi:acyl transferase domain-containing protein
MLLGPELSTILSNMNFLSPDGLCYSFDHRASGYSRGEGTVAIVLKPLAQALHDGDVVRAVIRATGSNSDGRTPGLTQPSAEAQEMLIRDVYQKAGLSFKDTRYVEAHGTGTPIGDPIEIKAIGRVFGESRSPQNPLYVGSIKSNVGHLEGASGLAGLVKAVLALEKGTIPPNALFEKINPALEAERYHIRIPTESIGWPTEGIRRASVNSFGFGGTNAHVILDGALHYLRDRGLIGYQNCTVPSPSSRLNSASVLMNGVRESTHNAFRQEQPTSLGPRLLVWTAADTGGLDRLLGTYQSYYQNAVVGRPRKLNQLAYTLAERRSHMPWRSFAVLGDTDDKITTIMKPLRAARQKQGVALIFTGQGAQYVGMGLELMQYTKFADTLRRIDSVLAGLGCSWSIFDALYDQTLIDRPQYSQPLCTALQLALVELLATFNITPVIVVGHSSGEIAAAYTIGALSLESAVKVAYYRGVVAEKLKVLNASTPGAMMSVNLPENKIQKYVAETPGIHGDCVHVACVNSPLNCTLSGTEDGIDKVKLRLDADGIFAQKLKTGVAYHSPSMRSIASEYLELLGTLDEGVTPGNASVTMISSVTGHGSVAPKLLTRTQYWADNLISPVRFADAIQCRRGKGPQRRRGSRGGYC